METTMDTYKEFTVYAMDTCEEFTVYEVDLNPDEMPDRLEINGVIYEVE